MSSGEANEPVPAVQPPAPAASEPAASEPAASEPAASEPAASEPGPGEPGSAAPPICAVPGLGPGLGPGPGPGNATWDWPHNVEHSPQDAPLQALMLTAMRLMGAYGQCTVQAAGLKVSLAGIGVLRVLLDTDGLKSSEVADRGWSSPGTLTAVVNTLARDGFVERRPDEADRRVVRLYITDAGRAVVTYYVSQAAPKWRNALGFVDKDDEVIVRRFFVQMINHLGKLVREERRR